MNSTWLFILLDVPKGTISSNSRLIHNSQAITPAVVAPRRPSATAAICASVNSGNIGSEINSEAMRSETGRLPVL